MSKYACPPQTGSGQGTFSDNLVGLQLTRGGGLTLGNFEFRTSVNEKVDRSFDTGKYSGPLNLNDLNISTTVQAQKINDVNFKVYPNFDPSKVTNYVAYGPLGKRLSASITNVINYFPAAIEVPFFRPNFTTGTTATNIFYDTTENITYFNIDASSVWNPFNVDFTKTAFINIQNLSYDVSKYRDFTTNYRKFVVVTTTDTYNIIDFTATTVISAGTLSIAVEGEIFSGVTESYEDFYIRPDDITVNEIFNLELDEVDELLLNRYSMPLYTSSFRVQTEGDDGNIFFTTQTATWPLNGQWNIDISTPTFISYVNKLSQIADAFDQTQTDLLTRFYTTDSLKEFDTDDMKVAKTLKIYGRSFDESKKYIDSISHMVSVNYNVGDDVPSKLLTNFAATLGWGTNISPIQSDSFLSTLYGEVSSNFPGMSNSPSLDELEYQYYRNLILNSAYLFKSKGTRRAIEFLMNFIGAPEALLEFNEHVYLADDRIRPDRFEELYFTVTGGTYTPLVPLYDPNNIYRFFGAPYTAYTPSNEVVEVDLLRDDFPIDENGYPKAPVDNDTYFFQQGEGWFESTPQHRSPEEINESTSVFTGDSVDIQTQLQPFTYGDKYLERFRNFPYLGIGFELEKTIDNKKSWTQNTSDLRKNADGNFDAYYEVSDDRLVLNVKNVDLFLNAGQALAYDVWSLSNEQNFPIPFNGLGNPYPTTGDTDWTIIDPKPQLKDFFEFAQTFWNNMVNVRNRQVATDGKTSGYPTLQSIFWRYLTALQDEGIVTNDFTYAKMLDYINGIGDFWVRLVEQFVPATTLWNTGTRFENSIFHRQKFIYRPQRGCLLEDLEVAGAQVGGGVQPNNCNTVDFLLSVLYNSNVLQQAINSIPLEIVCQVGTASISSLQYRFILTLTKNGDGQIFSFDNPEVFNSPNLVMTEPQWIIFINQGLGSILGDLTAIGVSATYANNTITLQSEDCEEITLADFDLEFINVEFGC